MLELCRLDLVGTMQWSGRPRQGSDSQMCGIVGAVDLVGRRIFPEERLLEMTGAIAHRGPDDEQIHIEPGVALGVRRLAIIDIAGGRQPISNETRDVWVAFEGELYEYPELREQLISRGHRLAP